jgi:hypothetical protein
VHSTSAADIDLGDRVILAEAGDRRGDVLGTVIDRDPYPERGTRVLVFHDDGIARWRDRDSLRSLGRRMALADLASDLQLLGIEPSWSVRSTSA